jgi:hypothetical protein
LFKQKHKTGKKAASTSTSRRNICKTIAIRTQLSLSQRFLKQEGDKGFNFFQNGSLFDIPNLSSLFLENLKEKFPRTNGSLDSNVKFTKWISYHNNEIEKGSIIMKPCSSGSKFFVVDDIFLHQNFNGFFISCKKLETKFVQHYDCPQITSIRNDELVILSSSELFMNNCIITFQCKNNNFICKKWVM